MAFTAEEIANINNATLEAFIDKGKVWVQNVANKPMLQAFNAAAGKFSGGKDYVSFGVKSGQGGGSLSGYTGDDQLSYYNPVGIKRAKFPWKEHFIGQQVTHTELKIDGIDIVEDDGEVSTSPMDGREDHALANLLDEKNETLGEDFAFSFDRLLHSDGSTDAKAFAGIQSIILDVPAAGMTGSLSRVANPYWRNRAATVVNGLAGGQDAITSATANGGALIEFLEKEWLLLSKYRKGSTRYKLFAGSDFIAAYRKEMRANGYYTTNGLGGKVDGSQGAVEWKQIPIEWDPTLDDIGLSKRMYVLDMGRTGLRLLYLNGKRMSKHKPARPYDRMVMYNGISTTCVLIAKQLNTSAVYDIK
ncbi:phage major capsid protein [Rhodopseudomonas pseudopalustris]|uniref:Phage major capsid protein, HK97 family n=1 Tax=Rhodopseudomonas pseudopalustris TaxID=1513892 RepID=A0A1H8WJ41_9BRAD|nr:phage major capsid protein [Rhodopseudomonas pseudopalustris]SEP27437.1 hypothetical protein SAMN05444123_112124 [Rhodopseudomonas pseudopalustris]